MVLEPTRTPEPEELEVAVEIIRNRVDGLGVAEPEISTQGGNILVQLPGVDEQQRALDLVGQTAELRFRPVLSVLGEADYAAAEDPLTGLYALTAGEAPADAEVILPNYDDGRNIVARYRLGPSAVVGDSLEGAVAQFHSFIGWHVAPTFKPGPEGIDLFNEVSRRCHSRDLSCPTGQVAIELDNEVVSAPAVQADSAVFSPLRAFRDHHLRPVHRGRGQRSRPGAGLRRPARGAGGPAEPDRVGVAGNRRARRRWSSPDSSGSPWCRPT